MSMFAEYLPGVESARDERVRVRVATPADVPALVEIDETREPRPPGHALRLHAHVVDPAAHVVVATLDDRVIGWTMAMWWSGHTDAPDGYYVSGITVAPAWRRNGAGEHLLDALLSWAWGRSDAVWSIVNDRNQASVRLHESAGFRVVARGHGFAGVEFTGGSGVLLHRPRPYRVLAVCAGNTCRSPMVEVVLRERLQAAGLGDEVVVDSSGLEVGAERNPVDPRARAALVGRGHDVPDRTSRPVRACDVSARDLVLAMTSEQARALRGMLGEAGPERVAVYRSFGRGPIDDSPRDGGPHGPATSTPAGSALDLADPWSGDAADYEACLDQIEAAADGVVAYVRAALARRVVAWPR